MVWGKLRKQSFPLNDNAESLNQEVPSRKALWAQSAGVVRSSERAMWHQGSGGCSAPRRPPLSSPSRLTWAAEEGINPWLPQRPQGPAPPAEGTRGSSRCSRRCPRVPPPPYPASSRRRLLRLSPHAEPALSTATSCGSLITAHTAQVVKCTRSSSPGAIPLRRPGTGNPRSGGRGVVGRWRRRGPHGALRAPALPGARGGESRAQRSSRGPVGRGSATVTPGPWCRTPRWPVGHPRRPRAPGWGLPTSDTLGDQTENRSAPGSECWSWNDSVTINNIPRTGMVVWCCAGHGPCSPRSSAGQPRLWSCRLQLRFLPQSGVPTAPPPVVFRSLWVTVGLIPAAGITRVWQQHFIFTRKTCSKIKSC